MICIYIVDDDIDFCNAISDVEFGSAHLKVFSSSQEALDSLGKDLPEIVVSDVMMPEMNGLKFLSLARPFLKNSYFIYISANSIEDVQASSKEVAKDWEFFRKPLDEDFYDRIDELVEQLETEEVNPFEKSKDLPKNDASYAVQKEEVEQLCTEYRNFWLEQLIAHLKLNYREWPSNSEHNHRILFDKIREKSTLAGVDLDFETSENIPNFIYTDLLEMLKKNPNMLLASFNENGKNLHSGLVRYLEKPLSLANMSLHKIYPVLENIDAITSIQIDGLKLTLNGNLSIDGGQDGLVASIVNIYALAKLLFTIISQKKIGLKDEVT